MKNKFLWNMCYSLRLTHIKKKKNSKALFLGLLVIGFLFPFLQLTAQTSYPQLKRQVTPVPNPGAPGDIFNPPVSGNSSTNAPGAAEWTRTAGPDESIVVTGSNLTKQTGINEGRDTRIVLYDKNGINKKTKIQRLEGEKAILTLDKDISNWGMYLMWLGNEDGFGAPITINKTDAWWIGPNKAKPGATTSIYGRNLAYNNGTSSSNVYIKSASGSGRWAEVTKVNPYRVDFTIPSDLPDGDYEIWTHNGHGGDFGWSGPLTLTIKRIADWTSKIINIKDYGAKGDGSTDDVTAINNAILAAQKAPFSTVYFPEGVYMISNTVLLMENTKYIGAGQDKTIFKCASNFSSTSWGMFLTSQGGTFSNIEMSDMTFDGNKNFRGNAGVTPVSFRSATDIHLRNLRFSFQGYDAVDFHSTTRAFMSNCEIIGQRCFLGTGSQIFIDSCTFKMTNDTHLMIAAWGGDGISITNSIGQDYDNSDMSKADGWGMGRFFSGNGIWGSTTRTYLANNTTKDLTVRPGAEDQNVGEHMMWEGNNTKWSGGINSATENSITVSGLDAFTEKRYVTVVKGTGLGQARRIISYSNGLITLEEPWNIVPDKTSLINIGTYGDKVVVYGNYLDGKSYAPTSDAHIACAGIEPFGGMTNFIADNNTLHELQQGISSWAITELSKDKGMQPNFFSLFTNNKFIDCRWAIINTEANWAPSLANTEAMGILGSIYRSNDIKSAVKAAIYTNQGYFARTIKYPTIDAIIYEHNISTNTPTAYSYYANPSINTKNQVFYKNDFSKGTASGSGYGLSIIPSMVLRENKYTGFVGSYNASLETVVEAPHHVMELDGKAGSTTTVDTSFVLYNSGVLPLVWVATSSASWLSVQTLTGNITNEQALSNIQLKANPEGLVAGTYTAYITITAGLTSKVYSVIFKVSNDGIVPNQVPVANAGNNQTITLPVSTVTLNGAASYDPDGTIASYKWTKLSGPASGNIVSSESAGTVVNSLTQGTYIFQLAVKDDADATATASVTITVNAVANQSPVANAGTNQTITLPTSTVTLNGGSSYDPDGTIATYTWVKSSGPTAGNIVSAGSSSTVVNSLTQGTYIFQLTVKDNNGTASTSSVTVTVNAAANQAPVANAGANQTITLPTNTVTLNGSASNDPDGTIATYAWTKLSGPTTGTIASAAGSSTAVNSLVQGTYVFRLTVTDNKGATATASVTVTVNAAANQAPVANAGANQTITLPVSTVTLNGSASNDPDGTIATYAWTKLSGPTTGTIASAASSSTAVNSLVQGTYVFRLTVTDNKGATATASVTITVNAAVNQAPVANAGANQTITLPTNTVTLNGSASNDPDGTIATYVWSQLSGPAQSTIVSSRTASTVINNLTQGTYVFRLTVTDNKGATATVSVTITVNSIANLTPVSNAGTNISVTLPVNTVNLNGNASYDTDGVIALYAWTKLSGPAEGIINNATSSTSSVTGLVEGTYVFSLTVTDNKGATGVSSVTVTVNGAANIAPVADAGKAQTVVLSTGSASLDGTNSYDTDGTIVNYTWSQVSGPSTSNLSSTTTAVITVSNLQVGDYVYQLTVKDNSDAIATHTVKISVVDNFRPDNKDLFRVYPNPARDNVNIRIFNNKENITSISIYDINGKLVNSLQNTGVANNYSTSSVNISSFSNGVYTVLAVFKDGTRKTQKFVKQ